MFEKYIKNYDYNTNTSNENLKSNLFKVTPDNLDGVSILIDNCFKMGTSTNENVKIATVHPSLWLGKILDRYHDCFSYVTTQPSFKMHKIENGEFLVKSYHCGQKNLKEGELESFLLHNKYRNLVVYYITKNVDLENMTTHYRIRFVDITEKGDERDNKIKDIFDEKR